MERSKQIIKTSMVGVATNLVLAGFKAAAGLLAGSISIVLDAVNNLSDVLSSVVTIIGTKLSQLKPDREHPFGHGRIEYFTAIIVSVLVMAAGVSSLFQSIDDLADSEKPHYSTVTLIVVIVAIVTKLLLGRYVKRQGEKLASDSLKASGTDALSDAAITLSTLVGALIMMLWNVSIDGILGIIISLFIIRAGFQMLSSPVNSLLGTAIPPELTKQIKKEISEMDGVHGVFDIILHNYGPEVMIGSVHINVYDTMNAHEIHGLTRKITEEMYNRHGIIMTVGIYAVATGENRRLELQHTVIQTLASHEEIVQVHGFYYFEDENRVSVDVVMDLGVKDEDALRLKLTEELQALIPDVKVTIVIDHLYTGD